MSLKDVRGDNQSKEMLEDIGAAQKNVLIIQKRSKIQRELRKKSKKDTFEVQSSDLQCTQCYTSYSSNDNLKQHIKAVHQKLKDYNCEYCKYSTTRSAHLLKHENYAHTRK